MLAIEICLNIHSQSQSNQTILKRQEYHMISYCMDSQNKLNYLCSLSLINFVCHRTESFGKYLNRSVKYSPHRLTIKYFRVTYLFIDAFTMAVTIGPRNFEDLLLFTPSLHSKICLIYFSKCTFISFPPFDCSIILKFEYSSKMTEYTNLQRERTKEGFRLLVADPMLRYLTAYHTVILIQNKTFFLLYFSPRGNCLFIMFILEIFFQ